MEKSEISSELASEVTSDIASELLIERDLFGGKIALALYGADAENPFAEDILEKAYMEGVRLQRIFNFYDKESELSLLNRSRKMDVSDELRDVIIQALKFCELTSGAYDISLGKSFLERKAGKPIRHSSCSYRDITIADNKVILKHPDVQIDLGSIAKGYIADRIASFLKSSGIADGMVDARGDMVVFGDCMHVIDVQHPRDSGKAIISLAVKDRAVATSGDYIQFKKSFNRSHILNQTDAASITVIAPTLAEADVYATALFVSDAAGRERIMRRSKDVMALVIDRNLNMNTYNGFENALIGRTAVGDA